MAIERREGPDGRWIDIECRPTHGLIRKIARETQRIAKGNDPLEAEDALVLNLVKAWDMQDEQGATLGLVKGDFERVPQDVWSWVVDECSSVLEAAVPNPQTRAF